MAAAARVAWPGNAIPTFRNNKEYMKKLDELVVELETMFSTIFWQGSHQTTHSHLFDRAEEECEKRV